MKKISVLLLLLIVFSILYSQDNSQFISQTAPSSVDINEDFTVTVTFKNTGTTTWESSEGYKLGTQSPQDNILWGVGNRVALTKDVAPQDEVTFTINLSAPATGSVYGYSLQWQMLKEGVAWFGEKSESRLIIVGSNTLSDSLLTTTPLFSVNSHVVGTSMFHWYGAYAGQLSSPWIPIEGRNKWTGEVPFWKTMIKQTMAANIDVFYILVIPTMEQERVNLFRALNELRREGWDVPKVCPFFDPIITYTIKGEHGDASTEAGKDEIVSHYIRFYNQYYSQNSDEFADDFIYTQDDIPVLDTWHVHLHIDNYAQMTRQDIESRLSAEFGAEHPIFNNGIKMITTAISPSFSFADEKVHQFEIHSYFEQKSYNSIVSVQLKPGYWDQNVRNPGYFMARNGGSKYTEAWAKINSTVNRIYIESFNEYDEGSGIYASKPDTVYTKTDGGMDNTQTDTWSSTNDPYEYIKTTATGAALFNDIEQLGAKILWHNIPAEMSRAETFVATILVRNTGNEQWNAANDFKFGELESLDPVLFGPTRYLIDDTQDEIPDYGGIFRGRVKTFNIEVIAPDKVGTYDTHWSMIQENIAWFGDTIKTSITVLQSYYLNESETICTGDSIMWHGDYLSQTGIYYDSLSTVSGHDSIFELDLTVLTLDVSVTQNETVLKANFNNAEYQWINCETLESISGEISQEFTATENGDYAVIITEGSCSDTSACYSIIGIGTRDVSSNGNKIVVYPNPVSIDGTIKIDGDFKKSDRIVLISITGKKVYDKKIQGDKKSISITPQIINMNEGVYIIQIISNNDIQTKKIIVKN